MALIKSIAGYLDIDNNIWVDEQHIEMHPLEEMCIQAGWGRNTLKLELDKKPSKEQEHEWLIDNGPEFVKQKRLEWAEQEKEILSKLNELDNIHAEHNKSWCDHADLCVAHGLCPNEYQGDARLSLIKPLEGDN